MKALVLVLALAAALPARAQQATPQSANPQPAASPSPSAYLDALAAAVQAQNAAQTPVALQANLAQLERIAQAAPAGEWLPRYYQARAALKLGFAAKEADQQDRYFDQADAALDAARQAPAADRAELLVLQAYIDQGRIMVSPMTRGPRYTGRVHEALDAAQKLSPDNPRVYLLQANDLYFRPAFFGGGPDKAKPLYEKALTLFAAFKPAAPLGPAWGLPNATAMLAKINAAQAADHDKAAKRAGN